MVECTSMKSVVFISNFLNHHQLPFCNALLAHEGISFTFIATEPTHEESLQSGFKDMNDYGFVLKAYEGAPVQQVIMEADAVIIGAAPMKLVEERLRADRLTFVYQERLYKHGPWVRFNPRSYRFVNTHFLKYRKNKHFYVLCTSAYLSYDLSLWKFPVEKCLKWGYFTSTGADNDPANINRKPRILWVSRLIKLKHPEFAVNLAEHLKRTGSPAGITIIGDGELRESMEKEIMDNGFFDQVTMLGAMPFESVYEEMQDHDIFIFASDYREGWGAVINEAMECACAPVVSAAAGASRFLIRNGENGLLFRNGDYQTFEKHIDSLLRDPELLIRIRTNARNTIRTQWNPKTAAERLLAFIEKESITEREGPCSPAEIIRPGSI
ncbi:MAG: glycosyltransferase [Solobacterium sp.]|nr:glycosyltransferase [Solobacterium sp.]